MFKLRSYKYEFENINSSIDKMWHGDLQSKIETDLLETKEFLQGIGVRRVQRCWIKHSIKMKYFFKVK